MNRIRQRIGLMAVVLTVFLASCSTGKVMVMHQDVAKQMEAEGNYAAATESWSAYFDEQTAKGKEVSAENYAQAAKVAVKADRKIWLRAGLDRLQPVGIRTRKCSWSWPKFTTVKMRFRMS